MARSHFTFRSHRCDLTAAAPVFAPRRTVGSLTSSSLHAAWRGGGVLVHWTGRRSDQTRPQKPAREREETSPAQNTGQAPAHEKGHRQSRAGLALGCCGEPPAHTRPHGAAMQRGAPDDRLAVLTESEARGELDFARQNAPERRLQPERRRRASFADGTAGSRGQATGRWRASGMAQAPGCTARHGTVCASLPPSPASGSRLPPEACGACLPACCRRRRACNHRPSRTPARPRSTTRSRSRTACGSEQQRVVILVRNKGLHPLD